MLTIIQCYLGKSLPSYVIINAKSVMRTFPNVPYFMVVDDWKSATRLKINKVPFIYINKTEFNYLNSLLKVDKHFRKGFWVNTTARFLALNFAASRVSGPILHIESDVILGSNFPFSKFEALDAEVAFPLESENKGCASVLYFSDSSKLSIFCQELLSHVKDFPKTTDMLFLGRLVKKSKLKVYILPSKYDDSMEIFDGFFDSTSWGQFFSGVDPRNNKGYVKYGYTHSEHTSKVSGYSFKQFDGAFSVVSAKNSYKLFALHVHSKNRSLIRLSTRSKEFERIRKLHQRNKKTEFKILIFASTTIDKSLKRVSNFLYRLLKSIGVANR